MEKIKIAYVKLIMRCKTVDEGVVLLNAYTSDLIRYNKKQNEKSMIGVDALEKIKNHFNNEIDNIESTIKQLKKQLPPTNLDTTGEVQSDYKLT